MAGVPGPMACAPVALLEALEAVMRGASVAPRHSVAAAAAACLRVAAELLGVTVVDSVTKETSERMACIRPVVAAHVAAGARGERASITGQVRRGRNAASHHDFGAGPGTWRDSRPRPGSAHLAHGDHPKEIHELHAHGDNQKENL